MEAQTEILTEYLLSMLIEQAKHNLFPKRPFLPQVKSPLKEEKEQEHSVEEEERAEVIACSGG